MAVLYAAKLLLNLPHPWPDCLSEAEAPKNRKRNKVRTVKSHLEFVSFLFFLSLHQKDFEVDADRRLNFRRAVVTFVPRLRDEISKKEKSL